MVSSEARCRLYSAVPRTSVTGSQACGGPAARLGEDLLGGRLADQGRRQFSQRGPVGLHRGQARLGRRLSTSPSSVIAASGRRDRPVADPPFDFRVCAGCRCAAPGIRTSISISLCATAVSYGPRWKSSIGISRSPEGPAGQAHRAQHRRRPSSDPRPDPPGTANRRACRDCGPPGRRSPARRRATIGHTAARVVGLQHLAVPGHGADANQGRIGDRRIRVRVPGR